jgi:maltose phosphorylase
MAGTWLSIVEGFGGMRVRNGGLSFTPRIPSAWKMYSFKVNFRGQILKVSVSNTESTFSLHRGDDMEIEVNNKKAKITKSEKVTIS